ncbi:MAG: NAD(P)H-dependent oxidoreductase [Propionibacterium sp.]
MKIGIVVGSVRDHRLGGTIARWVYDIAAARGDVDYELIDLKEFHLPVFDGNSPMMAHKHYDSPEVQRWSDVIDACDGFVFVTPEYNHSVPGGFKNAVDTLGPEWLGKSVAFVSYGGDGGVRAVEHWRQIVANFEMHDVRSQVSLSLFNDVDDKGFAPQERRNGELVRTLDSLVPVPVR